ncbi:SIR2 family NAD-dependent protein deacylase [Halogeometricum limi]|uniref:NAD-dependent deacetylase n=1 Tax=Halogeometricum limi TaxID=555875 RepID=A0A1I6HBA0_9EURY|nr:Sir2 family NAD-dependent protein deacetylase [Halogeometricum limi]SFR51660.1 NAD-dependent deacetylase [Halogeometricum limi]
MDEQVGTLAETLVEADGVTVLTGADVGATSGVPTLGGDGSARCDELDPKMFGIDRFETDPAGFWEDGLELDALYDDSADPADAHRALARLEELDVVDAVLTENTDGLHADAGTRRLVELHGDASQSACVECGRSVPTADALDRVRSGESPPHCSEPGCHGHLKPDAVLNGEDLSESAYGAARRMAWESDVLLVVGSSLSVEPVATLPEEAAERGTLVILGEERTEKDHLAEYVVRGDADELLPELVEAMQGRMPRREDRGQAREATRVR